MTVGEAHPTTDVEVQPVTPRTGAVVSGVDLASGLSDEEVAAIRDAILAHRVVFFRDQNLDADQHLAFAQRLGSVTRAHPTLPEGAEGPAHFDLDSVLGSSANHWHTDVTFVEQPPTFSILRAMVIPPVGGDTLWANTVAGYRDLRPSLKAMADELRAVHTNGQDYGRADVAKAKGRIKPEQLEHMRTFVSTVYETEHPVVRVHPETGERALLLGGFAQRLVGHSSSESSDILRTLQSYVTRPENVVRWHWNEGDVAVWDNRSTQHYAIFDYGSQRRRVQRITTSGSTPVGLDGRPSVALRGDASSYYEAS
jgi:alpha-ketoglutarate-dependent sulfate ester dioxygenase